MRLFFAYLEDSDIIYLLYMLYLLYNKLKGEGLMFIEIDKASTEPIYTQLINQLKKAIVKGEIRNGELLPSVRVLAGDLGVNMHTVNKAYNLLVDQDILVKSQRGYMIDATNKKPGDLEHEMKKRIEELLVDVYIHDVSIEKVKEWTQHISHDLKREW